MIVTRCVDPGEARRSVDWSVLVAIGSAIGIAEALEASGGAEILGDGISALGTVAGDWGLLLGVFFGTVILTELINQRYQAMKPTILLSNLPLESKKDDSLRSVLGERVISRLKESTDVLICNWEDYRGRS